jgi:putative redox protein
MATIRLMHEGGLRFTATSPRGAEITLDSDGASFSPMQLVLAALGGCSGMDVISILKKMRQDVTAYRIEVDGVRAEDHPRVFTEMTVRHIVEGINLSPAMVERAVSLSEEKYCSVAAMLQPGATIHTEIEVNAPAGVGAD